MLSSCLLCRAWSVNGGSNGKFNPAPASPAACWKLCRLCNNAAECSWAFLRSSATEEDLWSPPGEVEPGSEDDKGRSEVPSPEIGLIGQQEHSPGKAETNKYQLTISSIKSNVKFSRVISGNCYVLHETNGGALRLR